MAWTLHVPGSSDPWRVLQGRLAVPPRVATAFWMVGIMAAAMVLASGQGAMHWLAAAVAGLATGFLQWRLWRLVGAASWRPAAHRIVRVLPTKRGIQVLGWWHMVDLRRGAVEVQDNAVVLQGTPPVHIRTGRGLGGHQQARLLLRALESA